MDKNRSNGAVLRNFKFLPFFLHLFNNFNSNGPFVKLDFTEIERVKTSLDEIINLASCTCLGRGLDKGACNSVS